jgi:integrase
VADQPKQFCFFFREEIDVAKLRQGVAEMMTDRKRASNTKRAYEADLRSFHTFCDQIGHPSCPALPETVILYLMHQAEEGFAMATLTRRLSAIIAEHMNTHPCHPTPCGKEVNAVLALIRRKFGVPEKPKTPVSPEALEAMLESVGAGVGGLRDRALLLTGFASGMRRAELGALDVGDVTFERLGVVIRILRSKTDQKGKGQEVGVHRSPRKKVCPVRALEQWIAARGNWDGPLFPPVLRSGKVTGKRLQPRAIARVVKRAARRAGLDPKQYAGHSLRSGCATAAAAAGADIKAIADRLRHASTRTTEKYVRHGSLFAVNPLKGVL